MRNDHHPFDLAIKIMYSYVWSAIFCFLWSSSGFLSFYSGRIPTTFFLYPFIPTIYSPGVRIHLFLHSWTLFRLLLNCRFFPTFLLLMQDKALAALFTLILSWALAFLSASLNSQAMFLIFLLHSLFLCFLFVTSFAGATQINFCTSSFSYLSPSFSSEIWVATADKIVNENFFAYKIHPHQELP